MDKIMKKFNEAASKLKHRIEVLESKNEQDIRALSELEESYKLAIIEDNGHATAIKRNINAKQVEINERNDQIQVLQAEIAPLVKKAANTAAREYAKVRDRQEAIANKAKQSIAKAKAAYIEAVAKAQKEDAELTNQRWGNRTVLKQADDSVIQSLGLENDRDEREYQKFEKFFNSFEHSIHHDEISEKINSL